MAMYPIKLSFMIQVLLVFTCEVQTSKVDESLRNLLRESFQKALMNDSKNLLILQKIFLTPRQKNPNGLYLYVDVTVEGRIADDDVPYLFYIKEYCNRYFPQNNSCVYHTSMNFEVLPGTNQGSTVQSFLSKVEIRMVLQVLDPSFHNLARIFQTLDDFYDTSDCQLLFYTHVDKVEVMFDDLQTHIRNALYLTLSWAKAYAKSDGNQITIASLEDISWLMEIDDSDLQYYDELFSSSDVAALIFCTFLWLNILILIFTMLNVNKVYTWLEEQRKSWKDMYKASAGVLTFINLTAFGSDLFFCVLSFHNRNFFTYAIIKLLFVVMIIILELLVSCRSTLKFHNKKRLHRFMHALALCQIIWFGHRVATDAIISVIAFVIAPAQTLGTVTLLLATVVFMILFVSSLLKQRCQCCSIAVFCTVLIGICTIGLIITVTILFIALVDHGLQSAGIGGFILSIVPPMTIFVIGLCVNREIIRHKFNIFANEEVSHAVDDAPVNETITESQRQVNETTPLVQNN